MNRRNRTLAVVAMSIVMASVAAFGMYQVVLRIPVREVEVANYRVVVAAKALPMGTRLRAEDLNVIAWPSKNPMAEAPSDPAKIVNRGLLDSVAENEPITEMKLAPLEAGAGLSPSIPAGMRAPRARSHATPQRPA